MVSLRTFQNKKGYHLHHLTVEKRSGLSESLDITKIQRHTGPATEGLDGVSQSELEAEANIHFVDGLKTSMIQGILIKTAYEKIDLDRPNWTYVAARLQVFDIYGRVEKNVGSTHLKDIVSASIACGKYQTTIPSLYDLDELNDYMDIERDKLFTYIGIKTVFDRYLLRNSEGSVIETPQALFMGVAMFLAQLEDDRMYWAKKFYDILSRFEVMAATPTLSNARTLRSQCSSCYVGATPDSAEGIMDTNKEYALLSKFGGGIGWSWNKVRGQSSTIDGNKKAAGGVIPFLKISDSLSIAFDQLGVRSGAITVYLEPWHADILDFLDLRQQSGEERRRTHDLFPALFLNDLFMERAANDEIWSMFDPYTTPELNETYGEEFREHYLRYEAEGKFVRQMSAKEIWKIILRRYFETGMPFLTFKDTMNARNQNSKAGMIRSSNLCTEIAINTESDGEIVRIFYENGAYDDISPDTLVETDAGVTKKPYELTSVDVLNEERVYAVEKVKVEGKDAICNLASVNLSKVHTDEDFERVIPIAVRMLDNVIDLNFYPMKKVKDSNLRDRAIGLGAMGEHQMIAEQGVLFGTQEHLELIDAVYEKFSYEAIKASVALAGEKGSYKEYSLSEWHAGVLPIDTANANAEDLTTHSKRCDWEGLRSDMKRDGIRNGYLMAIAPTSSISLVVGTTQAIEPTYRKKWYEENLSGVIPVTAPNINLDTWNQYITAYEVDQLDLVKANAIRQKYIDQAISLNIFLATEKASGRYMNEIYMTGWKLGLKSTYYLRSESAKALEDVVVDRGIECTSCQ